MLLSLDNVSKLYADRVIFLNTTLKVEDGDRIGLVGLNGAGKTTLLHVLSGELACDEGVRAARTDLSIGFLKQNSGLDGRNTIYEEMRSVFKPLLDTQKRLLTLTAQMAAYENHEDTLYRELGSEYTRLQAYFENNGGYEIDVRIRTVLSGMGFHDRVDDTVCGCLSGGEKTRLALAKLLLQNPDLLMLDEPTNHLDFETLEWLESYLQSYKGALIVVSHDRYFLDKICTRIWEVANLHVTAYKGNYTKYMQLCEAFYERKLKEYEMQQKNVAKLTDYIARNKTRASTAALAKSKEKELERMEIVKAPPKPILSVRLNFHYELEPVKDILHVQGLALTVGDASARKSLCEGIDFDLLRGEKVALVGKNGVGKSSFLKAIQGKLSAQVGRIQWGRNVKVSYYEQETLDLTPYKTVIEELWDRYPQTYEQDIRNVLGGLHFSGETIYKRVDQLSGGEKARLKFAIMLYESGNVLLLDEPTNHLDLSTRETLDRALLAYSGTVLMVSHDRYLLSRVPTRIVEMHPTGMVSYIGGYETYLETKQRERVCLSTEAPVKELSDRPVKKEETSYYRNKRQRSEEVAYKKRLIELEQEISDLEYQITKQQEEIGKPEIASDYQKVSAFCAELDEWRTQLSEKMEVWATLSDMFE